MPDEQDSTMLIVEGFGQIPPREYRWRDRGRVEYRYVVDDPSRFPGFDGAWHEMSDLARQELTRMGGTVSEWLKSLEDR